MSNGVRAIQKEKTRRALINAAFKQLSPEKSFSNLSLREVTREAKIAPTSFYRHFKDMDDLGLTLVDEAGLSLRQLMRQARIRIASGGSVIAISMDTFFEFLNINTNAFRLLLRESSGTSPDFRNAVAREIEHFTIELCDYMISKGLDNEFAYLQAEAMVTLVFSSGAKALDMNKNERDELKKRLKAQLRMIAKGATECSQHNIKE